MFFRTSVLGSFEYIPRGLPSFVTSVQLCNLLASFPHLPHEDSIRVLMCIEQSTQLLSYAAGSGHRSSLPSSLQPLCVERHLFVDPELQGITGRWVAQDEMVCETRHSLVIWRISFSQDCLDLFFRELL